MRKFLLCSVVASVVGVALAAQASTREAASRAAAVAASSAVREAATQAALAQITASASKAYSEAITCANNVITPITCTQCGTIGYIAYAIQNKNDTTAKINLGYTGMTNANEDTTGFEYCVGCAGGAAYAANVVKASTPNCIGMGSAVAISVQFFQ